MRNYRCTSVVSCRQVRHPSADSIAKKAAKNKKKAFFCLYIKEKHYFCRVTQKDREQKYELIRLRTLLLFLLLL